jgi:hypothetical protein
MRQKETDMERSLASWQALRAAVTDLYGACALDYMRREADRISGRFRLIAQKEPRSDALASEVYALLVTTDWEEWKPHIGYTIDSLVVDRLQELHDQVERSSPDLAEEWVTAKDAWRALGTWLRGQLAALHREIAKAGRACERASRIVAALPATPESIWPLEYRGIEGELRAAASRQIAERNPHLALTPSDDTSTTPVFTTVAVARPIEQLHDLLAARKAWSEIFHGLGPALSPLFTAPPRKRTRKR